jgi:glycosyltransferase involved in cell wall biosynthesis
MRIVFLSPSGQLGGGEVALLNILSSLKEAQPLWELHLIVSADGPLIERARAAGVSTSVLTLPQSLATLGDASAGGPAGRKIKRSAVLRQLLHANSEINSYSSNLRRLLREIAPDILHTNGLKMHVLGALARPRKVALIWHVHDYVGARPIMSRLMRVLVPRCSLALTNSLSVAADLRKVCGPRLSVQTIYNGVDTNVFSPNGARLDLDALSGLPYPEVATVRVGMLATLSRWKGHKTFLRAFSYLPPDTPVRGYVVGGALYQTDGSQYSLAELQHLAQELGIAERFGFTGFVDQPAAAMRSLDVVVHGSTAPEPFGMVIAEGMACGRAVVASHGGGATELINRGVDALSHEPGSSIALAEQLERLIAEPTLRWRLGHAARATAELRFDRSRLGKELAPVYLRVKSRCKNPGMQLTSSQKQIAVSM